MISFRDIDELTGGRYLAVNWLVKCDDYRADALRHLLTEWQAADSEEEADANWETLCQLLVEQMEIVALVIDDIDTD